MTKPTFTNNWATKHFHNWEKWLKPLTLVLDNGLPACPDCGSSNCQRAHSSTYECDSLFKGEADKSLDQRAVRVLEIGCFEGQASLWFAHNLCGVLGSQVVCVDPHSYEGQIIPPDEAARWMGNDHQAIQSRFLANTLDERRAGKITYFNMTSDLFFMTADVEWTYDLIYLDGNHIASSVLVDSCHAWMHLRKGGLLMWDDYRWKGRTKGKKDRPRMAIDSFLRCFEGQYEFVSEVPPFRRHHTRKPPKQVCVRKLVGRGPDIPKGLAETHHDNTRSQS